MLWEFRDFILSEINTGTNVTDRQTERRTGSLQ